MLGEVLDMRIFGTFSDRKSINDERGREETRTAKIDEPRQQLDGGIYPAPFS